MCSVYHLGHELKPISAERQKEKVSAGGLIERNLKNIFKFPPSQQILCIGHQM